MTDRPFVLDDLHRVVTPTETSISPDGTVVVFVRSEIIAGKATTSLWAVSRDSRARRLTAGPADSAPRFSPDGTSIAFLRKVGDSAQLHLIPLAGGEAEERLHVRLDDEIRVVGEVRPPEAADLATYTKGLKGKGALLSNEFAVIAWAHTNYVKRKTV